MSRRNIELFIFDVFIAIVKIEKTASNFTNADDLKHDYLSWDSVVREFEIIGEASKYLIGSALLDQESQKVVDFRNLLIHHYFGIDEDAVWTIIQNDLLEHKQIILKMIEELDKEIRDELIEDFLEENSHLDFVVKQLEYLKDVDEK